MGLIKDQPKSIIDSSDTPNDLTLSYSSGPIYSLKACFSIGSKIKDMPYVSVVAPAPERVTEEIDLLFSGITATAKYFVLIAAHSVIPFRVTS